MPGDGDSFSWHQDVVFRQPYDEYTNIKDSYLQTIIVVDEITPNNGAIEYIPGSHKLGNLRLVHDDFSNLRHFSREQIRQLFPDLKEKVYLARPGDVMIWSVMIVHGSASNESSNMRMTYMNGFSRADAAVKWPYYLRDGKIQSIDSSLIPFSGSRLRRFLYGLYRSFIKK